MRVERFPYHVVFWHDEAGDRRFTVTDSGMGISLEAQPHLFEKFTQADSSTTRRFGGSGLGLAICRQLSELMGGTIDFASEPDCGSSFWFEVVPDGPHLRS